MRLNLLNSDETLFANADVFEPDHIPDQFMFRDNQLKLLAQCLRPALRRQKPLNALITGVPATGKTTAVRMVFKELRESTDRIVPVHVNCKIHPSPQRIISEVHRKLFGFLPAETGIPFSHIYEKVFTRLAKEKKSLVLALDDVSFLSRSNEIFYKILRAHEAYNVKTAVWSISTKNESHKLEDKVRSVFQPTDVRFNPYKQNEIYQILKNRVDIGLYPSVLSETLLKRIVDLSSDLRHGIEVIRKAVLNAESSGLRSVKHEHIGITPGAEQKGESTLEKDILVALEKGEKESGQLFRSLRSQISYSRFYRTIEKLNKKGYIDVQAVNKQKGKSRIIKLKK